ncbi:hypothetical protein CC80DRAFT_462929 [Byssothecium circinans]|uniref:Uncharacterized protein n=1 Tax=Byssothecium circinans TaxID=147558 RepID=A0A6A5UFD1_9PLEO|nr:hypothetical protein CC80DRAFT_462929 [Byssothecium circinans]
MSQRPDRSSQTSFELPDPPVHFDILDATHIKITVPANSGWKAPLHWHTDDSVACNRITALKDQLVVTSKGPPGKGSGSEAFGPGSSHTFTPGDHHNFRPLNEDKECVAVLEAGASQSALMRNVCGATLDADLYPTLASTPYWIQLLYIMLGFSPRARNYMVAKLLWVQIQMMRSTHDFYVEYGCINAPYLWWLAHPWHWDGREPRWTYEIMWWSYYPIAMLVQGLCYWMGRLVLGMKAEYEEYMPREGSGGCVVSKGVPEKMG